MQVNISGRQQFQVTPALREHVNIKIVERIERCFPKHITQINVVMSLERVDHAIKHHTEATVNVVGGQLFASCAEDNMYAAIDVLSDKLYVQIKKHKDALQGI
jgi:putative sigma-54 modulation protein